MLLIVALSGLEASAQNFERPDADQPVALVADRIDFDSETGRVVATGSVEEIRANADVRRAYLGEEDA